MKKIAVRSSSSVLYMLLFSILIKTPPINKTNS